MCLSGNHLEGLKEYWLWIANALQLWSLKSICRECKCFQPCPSVYSFNRKIGDLSAIFSQKLGGTQCVVEHSRQTYFLRESGRECMSTEGASWVYMFNRGLTTQKDLRSRIQKWPKYIYTWSAVSELLRPHCAKGAVTLGSSNSQEEQD